MKIIVTQNGKEYQLNKDERDQTLIVRIVIRDGIKMDRFDCLLTNTI